MGKTQRGSVPQCRASHPERWRLGGDSPNNPSLEWLLTIGGGDVRPVYQKRAPEIALHRVLLRRRDPRMVAAGDAVGSDENRWRLTSCAAMLLRLRGDCQVDDGLGSILLTRWHFNCRIVRPRRTLAPITKTHMSTCIANESLETRDHRAGRQRMIAYFRRQVHGVHLIWLCQPRASQISL